MSEKWLTTLCTRIPAGDVAAASAAHTRLDQLTKPRGSLGQIEALLVRLAGSTGQVCPSVARAVVLLAAADHGVAAEGVSAYPQVVTGQMVQNFLNGGAAINALAEAAHARLVLVDAGVIADIPDHPMLQRVTIRRGSGNIAHEPAMTREEALALLRAGASIVTAEQEHGLDILLVGEMGIANTTPAAAITSAITGAPLSQTVGRGTGIDDDALEHKRQIVLQALNRCSAETLRLDPLTLLCELGGLEIALLAGAMLGAAANRIPILLDGYITTSAALIAAGLAPNLRSHLFASHCSAEPGHMLALIHLTLTTDAGAPPLVHLGLRLGEGSGAALALPLLQSATRVMRDMATFTQAGVSAESA